jgi:hypothetical protein
MASKKNLKINIQQEGDRKISQHQKSGTGTNFIRAVPKIERSVNGA